MRVVKATVDGAIRFVFVAADAYSSEMAKAKKLREGDLLRTWFGKPHDHKAWARIHRLGQLMVENVAGFEHLNAHQAVKKLQQDAGVECDEKAIAGIEYTCPDCATIHEIPNLTIRVPRSLAWDEMDGAAFEAVYSAIVKHVIAHIWPELSEANIEEMASLCGQGN